MATAQAIDPAFTSIALVGLIPRRLRRMDAKNKDSVMPAKAGIQRLSGRPAKSLGPRLRGGDERIILLNKYPVPWGGDF